MISSCTISSYYINKPLEVPSKLLENISEYKLLRANSRWANAKKHIWTENM